MDVYDNLANRVVGCISVEEYFPEEATEISNILRELIEPLVNVLNEYNASNPLHNDSDDELFRQAKVALAPFVDAPCGCNTAIGKICLRHAGHA